MKTCKIETLIQQAGTRLRLDQIVRRGEETIVELSYDGFFYRDTARMESRRLLALLKRCYRLRFEEVTSIFGYRIRIFLR